MPRGRPKKAVKAVGPEPQEAPQEPTEKERLLALYETLQSLKIRSLSDLENLIAKA